MSSEVGSGHIAILPTMTGFKKQVVSGSQDAAQAGASGFRKVFASAGSNAGSAFANGIKSAATGVAAVGVTALAAVTGKIASFIPDAVAASDATDKFKQTLNFAGLKTSAIDSLTKSTTDYANKTVYDLADIQSVTAQLAANGVKGYGQLAEAAGNLNAAAGGNKDTFRSVGLVLTQTAGAGKLNTQNWLQLANAIPGASGQLQAAMKKNGAYTGNFSDALTAGQISAAEFNQAIMDLGMTDVAKQAATSTKTFEGAWGNLQATVVSGLMGVIQPLKLMLTGIINGLNGPMSSFFGVVEKGASKFASWAGGVHLAAGSIQPLLSVLAPLVGMFAALGAGGLGGILSKLPVVGSLFGGLTGPLEALSGPVGIVLGLLGGLVAASPELRAALGTAMQSVFLALQKVMAQLAPAFQSLITSLGPVVQLLGGALASAVTMLMPVIVQLVTILGGMLSTLLPMLGPIIGQLAVAFTQVLSAVMPLVTLLLSTALPILQMLAPVFAQLIGAISPLLSAILPPLVALFTQLMPPITQLVGIITSALLPVIQDLMTILSGLITFIVGVFTGNWSMAWSGVKQIFSGLWNAVLDSLRGIGTILGGIGTTITSAFGNSGNWLIDAGAKIIGGLFKGMQQKFEDVADWVEGIGDWIAKHKGPESYDRRLLIPHGGWIMGGLQRGLEDGFSDVQSNVGGMAGRIQSAFGTAALDVDARTAASGASAAGAGSGGPLAQLIVNPAPGMDEATIGKVAANELGYKLKEAMG